MNRHLQIQAVVVQVLVANNKEGSPVKHLIIVAVTCVALLALTAPLVLAEDSPQPTGPAGGCSGPDCKQQGGKIYE